MKLKHTKYTSPATLCDFILVEVGALSISATAVEPSKVDEVGGTVRQPEELAQPTEEIKVA